MAAETQELSILVRARDLASRTIGKVNKSLDSIGSHARRGVSNAAANLTRLAKYGALAGAALGLAALKFASDWESAATGVRKTVDGDVSAILDGIQEMSRRTPVAATELAAMAEAAGALGVTEDILGFTETVAKLAVTTDLTSEAAATSLGHLKTTLGLTGQEYERFGNTLVDLGNNGASTESEILGMAETIAGTSKIVGLSKAATLGWASALANTGEAAEAGGSSMQKFFLGMFRLSRKSGPELRLMAKTAGMSGRAFKQTMDKDFSAGAEAFIVGLGELDKAAQLDVLGGLGFTDIRITRALLKLTGNTDNLTDSLDTSGEAWRRNNAMTTEADKRFGTFQSRLAVLKNNLQSLGITIGTALLPRLSKLTKKVNDWLASPETQTAIKEFASKVGTVFDGLITKAETWIGTVDWESILTSAKNALSIGSQAVQKAFELFNSAPDWLKTAIVTGWGLNKLTGGAFGTVVGELAKGLVKGVMNVPAAVVNVYGTAVNALGGGAAGAAAKGAAGMTIAGKSLLLGEVALLASAVYITADQVMQQIKGAQAATDQKIEESKGRDSSKSADSLLRLTEDLRKLRETGNLAFDFFNQAMMNTGASEQINTGTIAQARNIVADEGASKEEIKKGLYAIDDALRANDKHGWLNLQTLNELKRLQWAQQQRMAAVDRGVAPLQGVLQSVRSAIVGLDLSVITNVSTYLSARDVASKTVRQSIRTAGGGYAV